MAYYTSSGAMLASGHLCRPTPSPIASIARAPGGSGMAAHSGQQGRWPRCKDAGGLAPLRKPSLCEPSLLDGWGRLTSHRKTRRRPQCPGMRSGWRGGGWRARAWGLGRALPPWCRPGIAARPAAAWLPSTPPPPSPAPAAQRRPPRPRGSSGPRPSSPAASEARRPRAAPASRHPRCPRRERPARAPCRAARSRCRGGSRCRRPARCPA